jgi:molecular chaperone HtpG
MLKQKAKTHIRFQEWSIGEVFVKSSYLIPNARRDGFEETPAWKQMRKELTETIVSDIKSDSYSASKAAQTSLPTLQAKLENLKSELDVLKRNSFQNLDKTLELSVATTKLSASIALATKNADLTTLAELQLLSSEVTDIKVEALSKIQYKEPQNRDEIEQIARDELLAELLVLFEGTLDPSCYISVRNLLKEQYGLV